MMLLFMAGIRNKLKASEREDSPGPRIDVVIEN